MRVIASSTLSCCSRTRERHVWKLVAWPIAPATRSLVRPRARRPVISAAWTVWKYLNNASRDPAGTCSMSRIPLASISSVCPYHV